MDLFVVNRYTGEDETPTKTPNEEKLKKSLLKKVKKRKELNNLDASLLETTDTNDVNNCSHSASKEDTENILQLGNSEEENHVEITSSKIKKKEKKHKHKTDRDDGTSETPRKKKKLVDEVEKDARLNEDSGILNSDGLQSKPFAVLGSDSFKKPTKVKRSIPQWLAKPSIVSVDLKNVEAPIISIPGLDEMFVQKLKENNITNFFPVQKQIIPWLLDNMRKPNFYWPNDICVSAPTGSGKTLAFVLPILQALHDRIVPQIRAIVILPVQDLAAQVYKVFRDYSSPTKLKILLLSKKVSFEQEKNLIRKKDELNGYRTLVDVIVTTAGRLVDHLMNTDGFNLEHLRYLVIDEADRVIDDMQNDWLYHLNKKILSDSTRSYQTPVLTYNTLSLRKRLPQKLLFSATLSQDPEKLQQLGLFQPKLFTSIVSGEKTEENAETGRFIGKYTTPAELEEYYALSSKATKPLAIHHLLLAESWRNVLCFVNSIEATKRLSFLLKSMNKDVKVKSISAKLSPADRNKLIQDFETGLIDVLISSDALARGIDIPNVKYVISYDCPKYLKAYVHRVGRTGRAGKQGVSLILLTEKENVRFKEMIENAGNKSVNEMTIDEEVLEQYIEAYKEALSQLESSLERGKEKNLTNVKSKKMKNKNVSKKKKMKMKNKKKKKKKKLS